jgi:LuxR family maltose regulon positive regulatory protein
MTMTLSMMPAQLDEAHALTDRGWAVVEIRHDGTLGPAELVTAGGPTDAARLAGPLPEGWGPDVTPAALDLRVGLLQAGRGRLSEAAWSFGRGARGEPGSVGQRDCIGHLALVEAAQGDLHRARTHAELALTLDATNDGAQHARLALAWVHLERADHGECRRMLDLVPVPLDARRESWLATSRLLVEARLLGATRRPDAATRILAQTLDSNVDPVTGWPSAALTTARADMLLAADEPRRALAVLTPLPDPAAVEASVVTAAGRHAIGDLRGAAAVLGSVMCALESAPLALQVRAWFLEARLARDRGQQERALTLVDRALHAAAAEDLRAPVLRDWSWLRTLVDHDPTLTRMHRDFLVALREVAVAKTPAPGPSGSPRELRGELLGASLTGREAQVLELLAQMYSTEEIAGALYVSANTVKTHLKGIFGKLCVNRRVDAVRRGRQLGLC